ncbi:MAG: hypothetical protein PF636_09790 [Actinomycetota bacterium]|jgi:hypothetical protein|nr:hypothetical protein [Actinomycetota bacterium]
MSSVGFHPLLAALAVILISAAMMMGCAASATDTDGDGGNGPVVELVSAVQYPADADLTNPESSVRAYLDWVTLSYRLANSGEATKTMTPEEWVRVDAYIELNRQQDRGIEQAITAFELTDASAQEPTATVSAREVWTYRYFSLSSLAYTSDPLFASYDTTYTVVRSEDGTWLVDRVDASAQSEVQ